MEVTSWTKDYERKMNHNYMILKKCDFFQEQSTKPIDYRTKMLLENKIEGLLPVTYHMFNGEEHYYYEINSRQSLENLYEKREMDYPTICKLLEGCIRLFQNLEEYLLDGSQILLKPEYIYIHLDTGEPQFTYYPAQEGDIRQAFVELADYILTKINHTDEQAVMLGYQVYRYTRNHNFVLDEISSFLAQSNINTAKKVEYSPQLQQSLHTDYENVQEEKWNAYEAVSDCYATEPTVTDWEENVSSDEAEEGEEPSNSNRKNTDMLGIIICIIIALGAGIILLGGRILGWFTLTDKQGIYLCGAMSMSFVASLLFLVSMKKKQKENNQTIDQETMYEQQEEEESYSYYENNQWSSHAEETGQNKEEMVTEYLQQTWEEAQTELLSEVDKEEGMQEHRLKGVQNGKETIFLLKKVSTTIGKKADMVDIPICDKTVSRIHAKIDTQNGKWYLSDLNSTNGTLCNGILLGMHQAKELYPGDELQFGNSSFVFL